MRAEKDQTCSQTIRKRRYSTEIKEGYIRLFWRIVLIVAVGWLLFTQVFLIGQAPDNEMFPAVDAGDLLIGFRMEQNFAKNDVVVYEAGGKTHVGRILGCETDVVTMDDTGTLLVNGTAQTGRQCIYSGRLPDTGKRQPGIRPHLHRGCEGKSNHHTSKKGTVKNGTVLPFTGEQHSQNV